MKEKKNKLWLCLLSDSAAVMLMRKYKVRE